MPATLSAPSAAPAKVSGGIDPRLLIAALAPKLEAALAEIGESETEMIRASLSVPVGRDSAGNVVERSAPDEPPRMDEGILVANIGFAVAMNDDGLPQLTITAERPAEGPGDQPNAAQVLEWGGMGNFGEIAPRPFMRPAAARVEGYAAEVVAAHLK